MDLRTWQRLRTPTRWVFIALAFLVSYGLSKATPLPSSFPLWAPPFAFAVCTLIGVFFGIHPARKAAHLDPIEALRAE